MSSPLIYELFSRFQAAFRAPLNCEDQRVIIPLLLWRGGRTMRLQRIDSKIILAVAIMFAAIVGVWMFRFEECLTYIATG